VVHAQWSVSATPAAAGRPAVVTAVLRERADSAAFDETAIALVIRCSALQLDAFLTTRDALDSDMVGDVRVRVEADSLRTRDSRWQATKSNAGAFIPPNELRDLIQRGILRSRELRITVPTLQRGRVTFSFPVSGFVTALDALRQACPKDRGAALAAVTR
jgi:hypothetical protein